jgi:protein O-GlcNAc transferase
MTMRNIHASGLAFYGFSHSIVNLPDTGPFKLRIGYISYDFADHPLAHLLASIFKLHDRSKFQVIGFSLRRNDGSEWRQKIE